MAPKGGGALTIQTYAVKADQVAELGSDILPIADYSALSVTDTGMRHRAERPRQDLRAVLHDQGGRQGHRPRPFDRLRHRQAVGRLHLRRFQGRARARTSSSTCRSTARRPRAAQRAGRRKAKKDELWGSGTVLLVEDEPMVRSVRRARAHPARLHGDHRRQWRGRARGARPGRADRSADQRRGDARHGRADHGPRGAQEPARAQDPVHVRLCRGAAAQFDRHRERQLPAQAFLGPELAEAADGPSAPNKSFAVSMRAFMPISVMSPTRSILIVEDEPLIAMMLEDFLEFARPLGRGTLRHRRMRARPGREGRVRPRHPRREPQGRERLAGRRPSCASATFRS